QFERPLQAASLDVSVAGRSTTRKQFLQITGRYSRFKSHFGGAEIRIGEAPFNDVPYAFKEGFGVRGHSHPFFRFEQRADYVEDQEVQIRLDILLFEISTFKHLHEHATCQTITRGTHGGLRLEAQMRDEVHARKLKGDHPRSSTGMILRRS